MKAENKLNDGCDHEFYHEINHCIQPNWFVKNDPMSGADIDKTELGNVLRQVFDRLKLQLIPISLIDVPGFLIECAKPYSSELALSKYNEQQTAKKIQGEVKEIYNFFRSNQIKGEADLMNRLDHISINLKGNQRPVLVRSELMIQMLDYFMFLTNETENQINHRIGNLQKISLRTDAKEAVYLKQRARRLQNIIHGYMFKHRPDIAENRGYKSEVNFLIYAILYCRGFAYPGPQSQKLNPFNLQKLRGRNDRNTIVANIGTLLKNK